MYKVLNTFAVGKNTSVTIEGNGERLRNDIRVMGSDGKSYNLISVAMLSDASSDASGKTTTVLIEGDFRAGALTPEMNRRNDGEMD